MNKWLHIVTFSLVMVGALNWGLVAAFNFNLVTTLFGGFAGVERVIYILVGLSAVYLFATHGKDCKTCKA